MKDLFCECLEPGMLWNEGRTPAWKYLGFDDMPPSHRATVIAVMALFWIGMFDMGRNSSSRVLSSTATCHFCAAREAW